MPCGHDPLGRCCQCLVRTMPREGSLCKVRSVKLKQVERGQEMTIQGIFRAVRQLELRSCCMLLTFVVFFS